MYLVYMGESGDTGTSLADANQMHHVHTGLLVHEQQCISMNGEFNALCRRHFGSPLGESGIPRELRAGPIYPGNRVLLLLESPKAGRATPGLPQHSDPAEDPRYRRLHRQEGVFRG